MKKKNGISLIAIALLLSLTLSSCYVGYYGPRRHYPPPYRHGNGHHHGGHHGGYHGHGGHGGYR